MFQNCGHGNISRGRRRSWLWLAWRIVCLLQDSFCLLLFLNVIHLDKWQNKRLYITDNLWACLPFWFLLTAINIFQQLRLKPLHQLHQIVTTTSLHHLASLPGAIVTKLDNTGNCFELGSYFKQAMAS